LLAVLAAALCLTTLGAAQDTAGQAGSSTPPPTSLAPDKTAAESKDAPAVPATEPSSASSPVATAPAATAPHPRAADGSALPTKYNVDLIGQRDVGTGLDFYSLDREMSLGRQLSLEVESSTRLITDPIIDEYINRIGQNLVRHSDARVPFNIKVLDNQEVNAFALPGGYFYVDSGLILAADNEAELAGVMAHEIAHVAARHATKNMTRAQIWNMASVPLIFIGGPVGYAISEVAGIAVPMSFLKFSRDAEREADLLGLEYDYATGYDPQAFVQFFEKLNIERKKPNRIAKAFATHPMNVERIEAAQNEIRKYLPDRPEYIVDTSEFENIKARLASLVNGRRLGGKAEEPGRPVLLKRMPSSSTSDSGTASATKDGGNPPDDQDPNRPTLKRAPTSPSDFREGRTELNVPVADTQ
jgi:predicted Zn-dependent protease